MRRAALWVVALWVLLAPAPASAEFGFLPGTDGFSAGALKADGTPENRAGVHPPAFELALRRSLSGTVGEGALRDLTIDFPAGFLINPATTDTCTFAQLQAKSCPLGSQVGVAAVRSEAQTRHFGLFNLKAPYGSPVALATNAFDTPLVLTGRIREADAGQSFDLAEVPEELDLASLALRIWGIPLDPLHDTLRGTCLRESDGGSSGTCVVPGYPSIKAREERMKALLSLPTSCDGPMRWEASATSWAGEGASAEAISRTAAGNPLALIECKNGASDARLRLTSPRAGAGTGLVFELEVEDGGGVLNPLGIVRPSIATATVALPAGLTLNPSLGNGLGVCGEEEFAREALHSAFGAGCPGASKVGDVLVEGMLGLSKDVTGFGHLGLQEPLRGSVFLARPHQNRFGAQLALYLVASLPERGLFVKSAGKVSLDPRSGQMSAHFEDLPKLLYQRFELRLREGQRPALVSPHSCGSYGVGVSMRAWGRPLVELKDTASLAVQTACPGPAGPPFSPVAIAGAINSQAGAESPFLINLTRTDQEAEITSYSAHFPPGALGRLAGVPYCPEGAIAAAAQRSGSAELQSPSCPAASQIGRTNSGYGVGRVLAYAPGRLYLAGPYRGALISVVAINPAVTGPFDLGTVVVRSAIALDPQSGAMRIDAAASDPIPHILAGVPLHLRDIRVYLDRPGFMRNPTSCDPYSVVSTLSGSVPPFTDPRSRSARVSVPFKAFGCESLGFSPALAMRLDGKTRRAAYPRLRAVLTPRAGHANLRRAQVRMPPSLFLAQEHLRSICARSSFDAGRCPPNTIYGRITVHTPVLEEPLSGPVYLRSSTNRLPDVVADLRSGPIRIVIVGVVDSVGKGQLRATFDRLPDAPLTRAVFQLAGGKRSLLVNSANLCKARPRALVRLLGQHNRGVVRQVALGVRCGKGR